MRLLIASLLLAATPALAQQPGREPAGFDFTPNGVWRVRAGQVRDARQAALSRGDLAALNAPMARVAGLRAAGAPAPTALAVTGTLYVPVILVRFRNTDATTLRSPSEYTSTLLGTTPPPGRPFTIRTFYEEMSNGLVSVQGQVVGWITLDSNDTWYEGPQNGLTGAGHVAQLMAEAVSRSDGSVNFSQFDNDGPDGIPNSVDDDGYVDMIAFIHPEVGGECGALDATAQRNLWAHRFSYSGWTGTPLVTADARTGGGIIRIDNYTIQSGLGGSTSCNGADIMPVGTIAHETGHGLGLPDFYDTNPSDADNSEGIGHWGLMGSGNYARPFSPAHMEGWSRWLLGWVNVVSAQLDRTVSLGAYTVADEIVRIVPPGLNPRGETWLVENRQAQLGDTALVGMKGPGLLIWHVDSVQYYTRRGVNQVNSGAIHGLKLMQADGLDNLGSSAPATRNRGDAGDPWPGTGGVTRYADDTSPGALLNAGGSAGFVIDSIRQVTPGGEMRFRLRYGYTMRWIAAGPGTVAATPAVASGTLVAPNDTVRLTATPAAGAAFAGWSGDTTSSSPQLLLRSRRAFNVTATFQAALAVVDTAVGTPLAGTPYADTLRVSGGAGVYAFAVQSGSLPTGLVLQANGAVQGTPTRDSTWNVVVRVSSGGQQLDLPLRYMVTAPALSATQAVDALITGPPLLPAQASYLDLLGNANGSYDLGDLVAWLDHTGTVLPPAVLRRLMTRAGP